MHSVLRMEKKFSAIALSEYFSCLDIDGVSGQAKVCLSGVLTLWGAVELQPRSDVHISLHSMTYGVLCKTDISSFAFSAFSITRITGSDS